MRAAVAAAVMAVLIAGCDGKTEADIPIAFDGKPTAEDRQVVSAAVKQLLLRCPDLRKGYGHQFTEIQAAAPSEPYPFMAEGWGWTRIVYVKVRRSDGHVLHYVLGGGRQPGILSRKSVSHEACGLRDGDDVFEPLPALALLK